jgi:hypothetical protein
MALNPSTGHGSIFLVFDDAHTFTGAQGAETACLIRRLRAFCGRAAQDTVCVATSATIVDKENPNAAREFASRFFGVQADAVTTVGEAYERETWGATRSVPPAPQQDPAALLAEIAWQLAELLATPTALDQLPQQLLERVQRPVSEEEVLAWLTLGAAARSDNRPLLRPVVHAFVRGISGAVVTFPSDATDPKLWLAAEDELHDTGEGDRHAHFPVTTCTTCGQHDFIAFLKDFQYTQRTPGGGEAADDPCQGLSISTYFCRWLQLHGA